MSKIINVGRVTSYADAVAGGYTGTREEWEIVLANLGTTAAEVEANRQAVAEDKAAVEGDVTTVGEYKDAAAQSASEALQSAESAHTDALAATAAKEAAQTAQGIAVEAKEAAAASRTAAESARDEADTSASAAAGSALVAQNAAQTATAQAGAAAGSATAAQNVLDSIPDDYTELSGDVDDLKSALNPIEPYKIKGVTIADGTNIPPSKTYADGYWVANSQGVLSFTHNDNYNSILITDVTPNTYTANHRMRFVTGTDDSDTILMRKTSELSTFISPSGVTRMYIAVSKDYWDDFKIGTGSETPTDTQYIWDSLKTDPAGERLASKLYGAGYANVKGDLADGEMLKLPRANVKKNNIYSFRCDIASLGSLRIGHGSGRYGTTYIDIDSTKITLYRFLATNQDTTTDYVHGLTISGYIYVIITVKSRVADIEISSNSASYKIADAPWEGDTNGDTYVSSIGSNLTNCTFTWICQDARKSVWMFGDSYFTMDDPARWIYYLMQAGYGDNVLLNAFPGENSPEAKIAINNLISTYGKPKYIIWCMGMNDASDTDADTPAANWLSGITNVVGQCAAHDIIPIFATIPNVPSKSHLGKNNYIRNSGYRYIDFATAVGAVTDGTWYSGMLSSDGIHPTEQGAKALFYQAMIDAPEITLNNP